MLAGSWRDFEELLPRILPHVIQCTEGFAIDHLRDATIRACERARLWVVDDEFKMGCDSEQLIIMPKDAEIYQLDRVAYDGYALEPVSSSAMFTEAWRRDRCQHSGSPRYFAQIDRQAIAVVPGQADSCLRVRAYAIPTVNSQRAPKVVLDRHREMLVDGALGRIMAVPNQPFSNPQLADYRMAKFERRLDEISREFATGIQRAPLRTRPNFL